MELEKIQYPVSPTVPKLVLDNLLVAIENGKIRVGEELPPERELAEKLGISRNSLRESLSILNLPKRSSICLRTAGFPMPFLIRN